MSRIGFVGTGHIAAPMARFLAARGHEIFVTRRNAEVSAALATEIGAEIGEAQQVLDSAEIIVLCIRPEQAQSVIAPLDFRADHRIVSVMAGVPRAVLQKMAAPATSFVQTIPLGFLEQGGCPLPGFGDTDLLAQLFDPENPVIPVASEAALNAHFAICAMVPGILDLMATGAGWLAAETGDANKAEFYTTRLVGGFLQTMQKGLAGERDALATAGTLSLQMTEALRRGQAHDALEAALRAIGNRLEAG